MSPIREFHIEHWTLLSSCKVWWLPTDYVNVGRSLRGPQRPLNNIETPEAKFAGRRPFHYHFRMMARRPLTQDRRSRVVVAARSAFGQYGYSATTTGAIAQRAGVSETTIFRYFGTKEALFDAAVLTPFTDFMRRHVAELEDRRPGSLPAVDEAELLFNGLIDLFIEERSVVLPLLAVYHFEGASAKLKRRLENAMRGVVALVEARAVREAASRGYDGFDIAPVARIMVGVCFSLVTFPRLFDMDRISRSRMVREVSRLTIYGVEFRGMTDKGEITATRRTSTTPAGRGPQEPNVEGSPQFRGKVSDETWRLIAPLIAKVHATSRHGRRPIDDRAALEGIIDVLVSGSPWRELPTSRYHVSGVTCWRRLRAWQDDGTWPAIAKVLHQHGVELPAGASTGERR
jgi:AcrR family transcriptional regulator/transposase